MPDTAAGILANRLLRMIQRLAHEQVAIAVVARVFSLYLCQGFFETSFVHITILRF